MTIRRGRPILLAMAALAVAGTAPAPTQALYRKHCRFCGPPWFYPEPEIDVPSLPHSFVLTVPVGGPGERSAPSRLDRYADVGSALGACWKPAADVDGKPWRAVTIRVAFKRDGTIFGLPRIPFADAGSAQAKADLAQSLLGALQHCTPLPFSPSLGAAIAGEIFAIRFTNQDQP
jgi:hypothetical protein